MFLAAVALVPAGVALVVGTWMAFGLHAAAAEASMNDAKKFIFISYHTPSTWVVNHLFPPILADLLSCAHATRQ